ncbi:hypothetical protein ABC565_03195 [Mycoplasmopsis synoviae]|uniref:TNase-like domain-containing protein n=1 Tax=Mycoplasmopsis synoviae TaxID=2109 RepID=A0AAX3F076_MYCSY|nr:hypothetical protein [Mycoplasmopsis synoviae]QGL45078.1 hypothetical protein EJ916_00895 [Mycoplasmopsis synoviae]QXV99697.1 hypothetical protein KXD88_01355 [Mycoplasmopsis synoviae]UBM43892.1 hypothetical protein LA081_01445 [Mycoplasmopsis synoviae]ULL02662.1 hypothetical protein JM201_01450 [Mycoplasmopsis synoviae]UZW64025.1 hypothetical protein OIE45_01430 [Mycoplasmopsis synoviae]
MKKIKKIALVSPILILTSISAISCGNANTENNGQTTASFKTGSNSDINLTTSYNYKLVLPKSFQTQYLLRLNENYYKNNINKLTQDSIDFNSKVKSALESALESKFTNQNKTSFTGNITVEPTDYILIPKENIKNYPQVFNLKFNNDNFQLKYIGTNSSLELGNLGEKRSDGETVSINSVSNKLSIIYGLFYNNLPVNSFQNIFLSINKQNVVNPDLKTKLESITSVDTSKFQKVNIDWVKQEGNYFDAKIVSQQDGDTFTVQPVKATAASSIPLTTDQKITIRLKGIDTPEKAVGKKSDSIVASPFEYDFAYMSTNFGKAALVDPNKTVRVAFTEGLDAFGRMVGDIFFGDDFQYSYSVEITRAGYTLPYGDDGWKAQLNNPNSYSSLVYQKISDAMYQAQSEKVGYYHYFKNFEDIQINVYRLKENSKWIIFTDEMLRGNKKIKHETIK